MGDMVNDMEGMTDKQFRGYMRLVLYTMKDIEEEKDLEKKKEKLRTVIKILRDTIED